MQTQILSSEQLEILKLLEKSDGLASFELAGGTALALQLGHRMSIDFDFFTLKPLESTKIRTLFDSIGIEFKVAQQTSRTLNGMANGVSFSFFNYEYPMIGKSVKTPWNFNLYSMEDIAAMKVEAIAGRGGRKDFIDLWFMCQKGLTLETLFSFFSKKFSRAHFDPYHRIRSLTYFEDAEKEPMPRMLAPCDWNQVKEYFALETKKLWGKQIP